MEKVLLAELKIVIEEVRRLTNLLSRIQYNYVPSLPFGTALTPTEWGSTLTSGFEIIRNAEKVIAKAERKE